MDEVEYHRAQQSSGNLDLEINHEAIHSVLRFGFKEYSLKDFTAASREVLLDKLYEQLDGIHSQITDYEDEVHLGIREPSKPWLSKAKAAYKGTDRSIKAIEAFSCEDPNEVYAYEFFDAAKEMLDKEMFESLLEEAKYKSTLI